MLTVPQSAQGEQGFCGKLIFETSGEDTHFREAEYMLVAGEAQAPISLRA